MGVEVRLKFVSGVVVGGWEVTGDTSSGVVDNVDGVKRRGDAC